MKFDDQPIQTSDDDDLLRSPVAKKLAEGIKNYKREESFVIGIQGEWGEGKTSFVNMVLESFEEQELTNDFIVILFNPWYFTGEDQILKQFCNIFSEKLSAKANGDERVLRAAKNIKKIATLVKPLKDVANFAGLSIGVPGIGSLLGATAEKAADFAKDLEEAYQPSEDLIEIKEQIKNTLRDFDKKIIVIIDDIDRLNKDEVYEVFRLVKIIADFPKTFYILSYDKGRVSSFLGEKGYDSNFIEKIIQQELNLPTPGKSIVYEIFIKGLNQIKDDHSTEINERTQKHFREIDYAGLSQAFKNLRSVKRVLNVIDFEFGLLPEDVNFIDLSVLCLLRVYAPTVYKHIQEYGANYLNGTPPNKEEQKIYIDFKNNVAVDEAWAIPIIEVLFPVLISDTFNHSYGSGIVSEWVTDKRICTDQYFKRYFALSVPLDEIPEKEYTEIYNSADDKEKFLSILHKYKNRKALGKILQRLRQRVENFPDDHISSVISILLDEADYMNEKTMDFFGVDADDQAFYLCLNLLKSLPVEKRSVALKKAVEGTKTSTNSLLRLIDYVGQDHGHVKLKGNHGLLHKDETFLSKAEFEKLLGIVLARISQSDIRDLFEKQSFAPTWFNLKDYNEKLAEKIRNDLLESENGFLKAVSLFCGYVQSSSDGLYRRLRFEPLQTFLENEKSVDELTKDIEKALKDSNNTELNQIVEEGLKNAKDPDK